MCCTQQNVFILEKKGIFFIELMILMTHMLVIIISNCNLQRLPSFLMGNQQNAIRIEQMKTERNYWCFNLNLEFYMCSIIE